MSEIIHQIFCLIMVVFLVFYIKNWNEQRLLHKKVFNRRLAEIASEYASEQIPEYSAQGFYIKNGEGVLPSSIYIVYVRDEVHQYFIYCVTMDGSTLKPLKVEPYRACVIPENNIY